MNLPNEDKVPLNANHWAMCRFSTSKDDERRFRLVWPHLHDMVENLRVAEVTCLTNMV